MAQATEQTTRTARTVYDEETTITLVLTRDEAETLKRVANCIGGSPQTTRRSHMDSIITALHGLGIETPDVKLLPHACSIYFA